MRVAGGAAIVVAVAALVGPSNGCGSDKGPTAYTAGQFGGGGRGGDGGSTAGAGNGGDGGGQAGQGGQQDASADVSPSDASDAPLDYPHINPTITMLTPSSLPNNTPGSFTLFVDGRDFPPKLQLCLEHNCWSATYVSETRLSAVIPGVAVSGTPRVVDVSVTQIGYPYLESNILPFTITQAQ